MAEDATIDQEATPRNWLITGGCGFIGTSLIRYLQKEAPHVRVRVMDNLSVGTRDDLSLVCTYQEIDTADPNASTTEDVWKEAVQLVVADIKDADACMACAKDMDVIVHLAANTGVAPSVENPREDMEANVVGTFNLLEASRLTKVKRFVFASSGAPVGECQPPIHEELAPHPVSPYGASKLAGEGYCSAYWRTFGLETVALRFGNVYGPGSGHKNSVVAKFIRRALQGKTLEIYGDGTQTRDFIFIEDLSSAILQAACIDGIGGETFQIATSKEHTVNELVEQMLPILEEAGITGIVVANAPQRIGDVRRNFSDTSKAIAMLGWKNETPLEQGLKSTVRWFTVDKGRHH